MPMPDLKYGRLWLLAVLFWALAACRPLTSSVGPLPTLAGRAATVAAATEVAASTPLPVTWTPVVSASPVTGTPLPTFTPRGTATEAVFPTQTFTPSATPSPTATPTASTTPAPVVTYPASINLLPNPSFEQGWYHPGGIPELQIPANWSLQWEMGENPLGGIPWVRPECRVLPPDFLPPHERSMFIWDGQHTVKIFKGQGAISFRLVTSLSLPPGVYRMDINVFPDLVVDYVNGDKVWAPDPLSGEVRFIVGNGGSDWILPVFGMRNTLSHVFTLEEKQTITIGAAMRGRWAILNNGWFMDDWGLFRIGN